MTTKLEKMWYVLFQSANANPLQLCQNQGTWNINERRYIHNKQSRSICHQSQIGFSLPTNFYANEHTHVHT